MHQMEREEYEETIAKLKSQLEASQANGKEPGDAGKPEPPMAGLAEMMKNPGMKDMIRAQQEGMLEMSHGALFKYLDLSGKELEAFKKLVVDKQMALVDLSLEMMDSSITQERRKEIGEQIQAATKEQNDKIKEYLGEEDYAVYQDFESTQQERMQVNMFKQSLSSDEHLSEEQEHDLIRAMHDERTNFNFTVDFEDEAETDPTLFTEEKVATYMEEMSRLQERVHVRAGEILTPEQLEQFGASQKQMQAMQEMGMKMAAQMFGTQEEKSE